MNTFITWKTLLQITTFFVLTGTTALAFSDNDLSRDDEALARKTLGKYINVAPEALELVNVEAIDWFDASLGCPEPGRMYAQMVVPGFRVVLRVKHQDYNVHLGNKHAVVCELPDGIAPPAPSDHR